MHVFGELLRGFRNREEVSQEELASQLNVHRQTIVNWENFKKNYRPRSQGMVEKIAEILALSPGETDQLLQAAGYPPRYSVVKQNSSQSSTQNKDNLPPGLNSLDFKELVDVIKAFLIRIPLQLQ